jgi:1-acyl-sn-glycerol-3-phosphate acyltransferase
MKKPQVRLDNFEAVYEYYQQHRPNKVFNRAGHLAMSLAYRPRVEFASDASETISRLIQTGKRLIIAANHVTANDQYIIASMAQREKPLKPLRGKTFIPSKELLFRNPLLRRAVDAMDAVPTFRTKDVADPKLSPEAGQAALETQRAASNRLIETSIVKLDQGEHMAIFPEGTRNPDNPTTVQKLKKGVGIIACGVDETTEVAFVPTGIYYGEGEDMRAFTPSLYIGQPITERFETPEDVVGALQISLQESVDRAVALAK